MHVVSTTDALIQYSVHYTRSDYNLEALCDYSLRYSRQVYL